jgi:hypothetical protein
LNPCGIGGSRKQLPIVQHEFPLCSFEPASVVPANSIRYIGQSSAGCAIGPKVGQHVCDVDQLAQVGLVTIETKTLPGHGLMKEIRAAAGIFRLEAMVI